MKRVRPRLLVLGTLVALVAVGVVLVRPVIVPDASGRIEQSRTAAAGALLSLRTHDVVALDAQLAAHSADPVFAHHLATHASPRDLGDGVAGISGGDVEVYDRALHRLAASLSLATHGAEDLTLPPDWASGFASATTNPKELWPDADPERYAQDRANKQNLLLLLSRGRWSTGFLQEITRTYWDWERVLGDSAWTGSEDTGARFAAAPGGARLTDGMVALMAALTANPEAAGWAFADFQPGTVSIQVEDETREIGEFAHRLLFEHEYELSSSSERENLGASATLTALSAAVVATGGSHQDGRGPRSDVYVLQDLEEAFAAAERESVELASSPIYARVALTVIDWASWIKDRAHAVLDIIALLPVVGAPADVASAFWSVVKGDWSAAGLSLVGVVPVIGDAVGVVKTGATVVKTANKVRVAAAGARRGAVIDLGKAAGSHLMKARKLDDGIYQFDQPAAFLAALDEPLPDVTYVFGETAYELSPDDTTLIHLGGPSREVIERTMPASSETSGGERTPAEAHEQARADEDAGLAKYRDEHGFLPQRYPFAFRVDGRANSRYFDGLVPNDDGTYTAVDVVSASSPRTLSQAAFDDLVRTDNPATVADVDLEAEFEITAVELVEVA